MRLRLLAALLFALAAAVYWGFPRLSGMVDGPPTADTGAVRPLTTETVHAP